MIFWQAMFRAEIVSTIGATKGQEYFFLTLLTLHIASLYRLSMY
jgi:hypothetical protein